MPLQRTHASLAQAPLPGVARHRKKTAGVVGAAAPALAQHPALWGGPCAGARFAGRVGSARCSRMQRPPLGAVTYANTLKPASPPGTGQDVQKTNVRRSSVSPIQSRHVLLLRFRLRRCFGRCARLFFFRLRLRQGELDEISLSDALLLLEAMKREVDHETTVQ